MLAHDDAGGIEALGRAAQDLDASERAGAIQLPDRQGGRRREGRGREPQAVALKGGDRARADGEQGPARAQQSRVRITVGRPRLHLKPGSGRERGQVERLHAPGPAGRGRLGGDLDGVDDVVEQGQDDVVLGG